MLLRFFRINDPYRLLGLLLLLILFSLPNLLTPVQNTLQELWNFVIGESIHDGKVMYVSLLDSTAPLAANLYGLTDFLFGRSVTAQHLLALVVIFFQAGFFAVLLINNKAYNDNTYVPALIFGLLCFFSFDLLSLSPELLGSTLLLLALNNLFKEIEFRIERDEIILNLGVYLGLATLVIFSYAIFLVATIMILIVFTRLSIRKLLLLLFGFLLPHGLLISLYFLRSETTALFHYFYFPNLTLSGQMLLDVKALALLCLLPFVYFVLSLFMLNREAHFTKYQSQLFQVMFQWMLVCLIHLFIAREITPHSLLVLIPSLAYFISHYLLLIRRKWIAETMLWTFMIGILAVNILARHNKIDSIRYTKMFPVESVPAAMTDHRVMVLADDPGVYQHNRLAGYFLDWNLSKEIWQQPDYYENVILVANAFKSDPPDEIIDPANLMTGYMARIPELKARYSRDGMIYRKIK